MGTITLKKWNVTHLHSCNEEVQHVWRVDQVGFIYQMFSSVSPSSIEDNSTHLDSSEEERHVLTAVPFLLWQV